MLFDSELIYKKEFINYFATLLRIQENEKKYESFSFCLECSVQSRGILYCYIQEDRAIFNYKRKNPWGLYYQNFCIEFLGVIYQKNKVFSLVVCKFKKKSQEILFQLKIGGEADNTRTEFVATSCRLLPLNYFNCG
jgi:hypothetical protein